jgi:hypothetical protein
MGSEAAAGNTLRYVLSKCRAVAAPPELAKVEATLPTPFLPVVG